MDPYKLLGISENKVKHPSDLGAVRRRSKDLFKRYSKEGKKFDAKKVLEAFEMVKAKLKNRPGEGQYKLLGRSRKERELDKHFNHQTKEIKKDKGLKRQLQRSSKGEKRFRLPGEKERVARPRRREMWRRHKRRKMEKAKKRAQVDVLEGLQRLAAVLPVESKFPKVVKLLYRWIKEYMNIDNRGFIFAVLEGVTSCDFITEDPEARQDVVMVFEYVLGYFNEWFELNEDNIALKNCWQLATVQACKCFTDDPFILSNTITQLNQTLQTLERSGPMIDEWLKEEEERKAKAELKKEEEKIKQEVKPEPQQEVKDEKKPMIARPLPGMAAPVKSPSPEKTPAPLKSPDMSEEGDEDVCAIDSDSSMISSGEDEPECLEIDSGDEDDDAVKEEIDLDSGSSSDCEAEQNEVFPIPDAGASLDKLRKYFVERCLGILFRQRGPMWARPKIDAFFQEVFYRRKVLTPDQQTQLEAWQARIKTMQKMAEHNVGEANSNPLEAHRPVVDSREMKTVIDSDSNSWAAKQTFDSRESSAGKVIR